MTTLSSESFMYKFLVVIKKEKMKEGFVKRKWKIRENHKAFKLNMFIFFSMTDGPTSGTNHHFY